MSLLTNLVSYYKLDNLVDSVSAFNLTNNGSAPFNAGKIGNAFDGGASNTTKYLTYGGNMGIAGNGDITMSCWVKLTNAVFPAGQQMTFMGHRSTLGADRYIGLFYAYNSGTPQLRVGEGGVSTANYTQTLSNGTWYHVVGVRSGSTYYLYLNGIQVATASIGTAGAGQNGFVISNEVGSGNNIAQVSGMIDECGVWSRALSGAEITELYNTGAGKQYPFINNTYASALLALI